MFNKEGTFSEVLKFLGKVERFQEKVDYQISYFIYIYFFCDEALYRNHIILCTKPGHEIDVLVKKHAPQYFE